MSKNDLNNKKSFHPSSWANQVRRYDAEHLEIALLRRERDRQYELEEERAQEELERRLADASGTVHVDRVDWMYQGPDAGTSDVVEEKEAFLLGKRRIDSLICGTDREAPSQRFDKFAPPAAGAGAMGSTADTARDMAAKMKDDPLFAIKRQEQAAYEAMVRDPVKRRIMLAKMGRDGEERAKDYDDDGDNDETERRARRRREKEERREERRRRRRRRTPERMDRDRDDRDDRAEDYGDGADNYDDKDRDRRARRRDERDERDDRRKGGRTHERTDRDGNGRANGYKDEDRERRRTYSYNDEDPERRARRRREREEEEEEEEEDRRRRRAHRRRERRSASPY